ncbi:glycosyltransferase family 4 protein [Rivibacter subsaxonicus]|uniref:UDP-N-acetylmuramyl pentapeptide phosphotransferase/UDP-N-acetylglucosamine-1-phosphate transferase n=1 Tax=Rivibacter subsaxonicus TaxID=457575 RepID=A0A4Q7VGS8_9BURK|nr:glycosyltransferase [Rivibacter subsaxonicus]RZT95256.1 UDP-N-acetylmuramyl pentapeptide phosphotransferase/UDP-N-acetylglucosamine-1-phosphate transferase [Rivibacter subsaxonicus]
MTVFLLGFAVASLLTLLILRAASAEGHVALDSDLDGPQKMHARPVPRIGGVGIALGTLAAVLMLWRQQPAVGAQALVLLACALPALGAGLVEDLTKGVSPGQRLAWTAGSALLAAWLLGAVVTRTGIPGLDLIAATALGSVLLAVFVVAGVANSVNIIDGMNGLASMCVVIMMAGLCYVAFDVGDQLVAFAALAVIGAVLGFFMWNYPRGLIFLGDGGAYFLGFMLAELGILLVVRNPQVSPIFPLLLCAYPIFETLFSMYRRKVVRGRAVGMPDGIHLHTLIYRRLMRWAIGATDAAILTRRNSMTSPYLWVMCSLSVIPSVLWWGDSAMLSAWMLLFVASYVLLYSSIVRFRTPRILIVRRRSHASPSSGSDPGR